jgi:hypothetical protein
MLGLMAAGWTAGRAEAAATTAPTYTYSTVGSVDPSSEGIYNLVYFNGLNNSTVTPPDTINLGQFVVSSLAKTTDATYNNTPFQIIASVGGDASARISGMINGSVGPDVSSPSLTATISSVSQYGNNPLPFTLNVPTGTASAMTLALTDGTSPAPTGVVAPAAIPEPSSIAVFTVALGGLGLWHRRRAAR